MSAPRQQIQVEADQPIAGRHLLAVGHVDLEALTAQRHRLETDMHQDLGAVVGPERHRVPRFVHLDHHAGAGCEERLAERVDRQAVAHHALGEDRIRRLLERRRPAGEWGEQGEPRHFTCSGVGRGSSRTRSTDGTGS